MSGRSLWKGSVRFGLVMMPIKLVNGKATENEIKFNLLHKGVGDEPCGERIRQKRVCAIHGEVDWMDVCKGYEHAKGQYLAIDKEELLEQVDNEKAIDIVTFVPFDSLDPMHYNGNHYIMEPEKGAAPPYALLLRVLEDKGLIAIGQFVMRTKQYLCVIRPSHGALVVSTLLYSDEVNEPDVPALPAPRESELQLANKLVEAMTAKEFEISQYKDEHKERVLAMLEAKLEGKEFVLPEAPAEKPMDLRDALAASLNSVSTKAPKPERERVVVDAEVQREPSEAPAKARRARVTRKA